MRIGIFGCSSAVEHYSFFPGTTIPNHSWSYLLKEKYTTVENFAQGASSLYFSYKTLIDNEQKNFDKIIFIVTDPHRYYFPNLPDDYKHIAGFTHLEHMLDKAQDKFVKKVYQAVMDYEVYAKDPEFYVDMHNLMVNKLLNKRGPNFLLLSMTNKSIPGWQGNTLKPIYWLDIDHYHLGHLSGKDMRKCHMNRENNKIFAERIDYWIKTGTVDFDIKHFVTSKWPEHYYFY